MNTLAARLPAQDADTLVSVIMPVYNAEQTLRRSAESVLAQSFGQLELILIDDGSRDGSAAIVEELSNQYWLPSYVLPERFHRVR